MTGNATNVTRSAGEPLVAAAKRHDMLPIAVMVASHRTLKAEGFPEAVLSDSLCRLLPFLERLSGIRQADLGWDGSTGLGQLNLVRRAFGDEILPLWQWKPGSNVAGGDRVAQIRLGQQYLTPALRADVDGEGDVRFDVMVPCPHDDERTGPAWVPAYSVTCLFRAERRPGRRRHRLHRPRPEPADDQDDEDAPGLEKREFEAIHG
ncbi:hypothetical protein [Streptomyces anulatus]|uniref:hypothetical protein n=1 Tax=Streptomyces anulatus TaxID=1892 RepID=UPI003863F05A|nr:hypothetical protein OG238_04200 [Streptomyces anulatus]WSU93613.1 hypothetical protein OG575_35375 [Streptomyces anulatus]